MKKKYFMILSAVISFCATSCAGSSSLSGVDPSFVKVGLRKITSGAVACDTYEKSKIMMSKEEALSQIKSFLDIDYKEVYFKTINKNDFDLIAGYTSYDENSVSGKNMYVFPYYQEYIFCVKNTGSVTLANITANGNYMYEGLSNIAFDDFKSIISSSEYGKRTNCLNGNFLSLHLPYLFDSKGNLCYGDDLSIVSQKEHYIDPLTVEEQFFKSERS